MPSKLRKAIAAVKDQTSISLAKVGGSDSSNLEVAILKATTHDEVPIDERHVTEVLQYVSSNRSYAGSCARAIGRRIGRTRNWVVAVKSLVLVLRIFQDGDPHFPKEVLHAMKRGYKILNLSSFRDESTTSCPWDFTAFIRTFALYLDERLDCFLTGKLQRRTTHHELGKTRGYARKIVTIVRDMKPSVLLDRISHWQRLLDRAIATRPTGEAKKNRLVQTCLYAVVQETFELYRDISDGLALLLDSFFHLQYNNCVSAFQTCVKASKQFQELCSFYDLCKTIGVGRTSEYPSVQKISDELVDTLQEFLKDQSSFPGTNGRTPGISTSLPPLSPKESDLGSVRRSDLGDRNRSMSEYGGSHCTSLEDLIGADPGFSPDRYSDPGREDLPQSAEFFNGNGSGSVRSDLTDNSVITSVMDLLSLDGPSPSPELQVLGQEQGIELDDKVGWELVLFETSNQSSTQPNNNNAHEIDLFSGINDSTSNLSTSAMDDHYINPFLADTIADLNGISGGHSSEGDLFGSYAHTSSFDANFPEGGFPVGIGSGIGSSTTTAPTFQAEFGNSSMNGSDNFSSGFPTNLGRGIESSTISGNTGMNGLDGFSGGYRTNSNFCRANSAPTFKADIGDDLGNQRNGFVTNQSNTFRAPTFQAEFSNTNTNGLDHFSIGFPANLGFSRNNSLPITFQADFGDDFGSERSSFVADLGLGTGNTTTSAAPTFQAFGSSSMNGLDHLAVGFPTNLGLGRNNSAPTFKADCGDNFGSERNGFVADIGLGTGNTTTSAAPTFQAFGSSSMNGLDHLAVSFPTNLGLGRNNSAPTFKADCGDNFGSERNGFVADIGLGTVSNATTPTFQADFGNNSMNRMDHLAVGFPTTPFVADFGDGFGNENSSIAAPTFKAEANTNTSIGNNHQTLPIDLFAEFDNVSAPKLNHQRIRSDSFGPRSNDMNAIVIFSQPSNDSYFSSGPKFQAAPTFRANSIDMDHQSQQNISYFDNDPFGSFVAMPAVEQQRQLWLQNQNKIMARHLT